MPEPIGAKVFRGEQPRRRSCMHESYKWSRSSASYMHDMLAILFWYEAAQTLQQILEHNPKRARPTKRKLRAAADGPKEIVFHVKKEKPGTSKPSRKQEELELWQIIDSDAESGSDCVCEMAASTEAAYYGYKVGNIGFV